MSTFFFNSSIDLWVQNRVRYDLTFTETHSYPEDGNGGHLLPLLFLVPLSPSMALSSLFRLYPIFAISSQTSTPSPTLTKKSFVLSESKIDEGDNTKNSSSLPDSPMPLTSLANRDLPQTGDPSSVAEEDMVQETKNKGLKEIRSMTKEHT